MAEFDDTSEKTEEATPRKREQARGMGQVALSQELVTALVLSAGAIALLVAGPGIARASGGLIAGVLGSLGDAARADLDPSSAAGTMVAAARSVGWAWAALVAPIAVVALLAGYGQVGFRVVPQALQPKWSRLSPSGNLKKILSARGFVRIAIAALHVLCVAGAMWAVGWEDVAAISALAGSEPGPFLAAVGPVTVRVGAAAIAAILALALIDLLYQRWQHGRDLRMSRQELKEEVKATEGDPHVRARVRAIQREVARRRMMAEVPKATVVVTNPTHVAVALSYPRGADGEPLQAAPRVVAKGLDQVAARIKEIARGADVPCYEDVRLARSLHADVELGGEIPAELYAAVAEVLNYVYRLRGAVAV